MKKVIIVPLGDIRKMLVESGFFGKNEQIATITVDEETGNLAVTAAPGEEKPKAKARKKAPPIRKSRKIEAVLTPRISLQDLGLSKKSLEALANAGVTTLAKLKKKTVDEVQGIPGFSNAQQNKLFIGLEERGIKLKDERE